MDHQSHEEPGQNSGRQNAGKKKQDQLIGTKVDDRYEILSVIGHGATTSVYKAQDIQENRLVAIKMLHTHSIASEMTVRRFDQECKTLALLRHANIVTQYASGITEQDQPFLVMEYLDGLSLMQMILDQGAIPVLESLSIFMQACAGLSAAHEKGIVHRDMKPANIMITKDAQGRERVKILDFGVAKLLIQGETFQTKTQTGEMLGTLLYMSPEQCLDQDLDGRSDVYSLGCVLFEALTGKPPICGRTAFETMNQHLTTTPQKLCDVRPDLSFPNKLEKIVKKAIEKQPKLRFQKIEEFEAQLKELLLQIKDLPRVLPVPLPAVKTPVANAEQQEEEPPKISSYESTEFLTIPEPKELVNEDRSREGTINFLAAESMDGVPWQRIYSEQIKAYAISDKEVLQEQGRLITRRYDLKEMEKFAIENFASLDQNSDEFVSKEELRAALKSKKLRWREVHFVTFLLDHLHEIRGAEFDAEYQPWPVSHAGISRKDVTEYFRMLNERLSPKTLV
jgi:serine/threonine protein kinase